MRRALVAALCGVAAACGAELPRDTTHFTVGRTVVRTDATLDLAGVVFSIADTATVPARGPVRHWLEALRPLRADTPLVLARALGAAPVSIVLETFAAGEQPDSACGDVAPGRRLCLTGNDAVRRDVAAFLAAVARAAPALTAVPLDDVSEAARLRDLSDVYTALTRGKALDSAVSAYSGYADLSFDVTLARTLETGNTAPGVDPARPSASRGRIFLPPDPVFPVRSYRSPSYVWLVLIHQMSHEAVRRLFEERPELLAHGFHLREAAEPEMARVGYAGLFWDEILGEQLARALTVRILRATSPTVTWAARADALNQGMALVPWLEDVLARYESQRDRYPTLAAFAPDLAAALDTIPLDTCRGAPSPRVGLAGVERHRAVVRWLADDSPFRAARLLEGDTVLTIDGDSVAGNELLLPTRQLNLKWSQHLPFELGTMTIRRRGRSYGVSVPINWIPRRAVRIASQARSAVQAPGDTVPPICRWITRARRR
jgi:hypothetical protein